MEIKMIEGFPFTSYTPKKETEEELIKNSQTFFEKMDQRRSVRHFSEDAVPREVIEWIVRTASTAPSGAHKQPWTFCVISDPTLKKAIRLAAEEEERLNYSGRMNEQWLKDLAPLGTDENKSFLETVPYLIVLFRKNTDIGPDGQKIPHYYVAESVGIAAGFLIAAIHMAGLATLTHTPSPMGFLSDLLQRPSHEKPFLLLPVGYPAAECWVPDIQRKPLEEISIFFEDK